MRRLEKISIRHISVYGADNEQRLTGYMKLNRSIRFLTVNLIERHQSGYLCQWLKMVGKEGLKTEAPASNGDPYKIAAAIISTTKTV